MHRTLFDDEHVWFPRVGTGLRAARDSPRARASPRRASDRSGDLASKAGRCGFLGVGFRRSNGGSGVSDFRFNAVLGEELSLAGVAYASAFQIHTRWSWRPTCSSSRRPSSASAGCPKFVTGEHITAIAMTEPEAGSDLAALRTTAAPGGSAG